MSSEFNINLGRGLIITILALSSLSAVVYHDDVIAAGGGNGGGGNGGGGNGGAGNGGGGNGGGGNGGAGSAENSNSGIALNTPTGISPESYNKWLQSLIRE